MSLIANKGVYKMKENVIKKWPGLPLRQAIVCDNELFLEIAHDSEKEATSLSFCFGKYTQESYGALLEVAALLFKTSRSGVCALTKETMKEDVASELIKQDDLLGGIFGYFDSKLKIEKGRIIYTLTSEIAAVCGEARYDLGIATKENAVRLKRKIKSIEEKCMIPAFFVAKHHFNEVK